ncbi:MAG: hypothetical protein ACE5OS_08980 [Anaerolineae bacterium]
MSTKKALPVLLIASGVMLAVGIGSRMASSAQALPPAQEPAPPVASPERSRGVTIPYPGRLSDDAGQPVADGTYDFTFALYDAETGGEPLWSEVQEGVTVQEGAFVTMLGSVNGIPREALEGRTQWLEVGVRGPGEAEFTALTPRQRLTPASPAAPSSPSAGPSCPHDHFGETWIGEDFWGLYIYNTSGLADTKGILASSKNGPGVYGSSENDYGGYFFSSNDHLDLAVGGDIGRINAADNGTSQLWLSSNADMVFRLDNDGGGNHTLRVKDSGGNDVCTIDESGNLNCTGSKSAVVRTANHGQRLLYAVESPEVWFEDFGSAALVDGEITVSFDPLFAETVNLEDEYHVFVTPLCQEPALLFVTDKDVTGFTVQGVTLDGQPSHCSFDYRIVAKRLGYENLRLEKTTWQEGE